MKYAISLIAVFAGGIAQGIVGFGFSLVSVPVQILLFGADVGVRLTNELASVVNVVMLTKERAHIRWRSAVQLLIPGLFVTPLAAWLAHKWSPTILGAVAGSVTVVCVIILAKGYRAKRLRGRGGAIAAGAVSATMNTLAAVGGPAVAMYAVNSEWPVDEMRATFQVLFVAQNVLAVIARGAYGITWWFGLALASCIITGTLIGRAIADKLPEHAVRRGVLVVAGAGGVAALVKALVG